MSSAERLFCTITWGEQLDEPLQWSRVRHMVASSVIKNISEADSNRSLHQTQLASSSENHMGQECSRVVPSDQCSQKGRDRAGLTVGKQQELNCGNIQGPQRAPPRQRGG